MRIFKTKNIFICFAFFLFIFLWIQTRVYSQDITLDEILDKTKEAAGTIHKAKMKTITYFGFQSLEVETVVDYDNAVFYVDSKRNNKTIMKWYYKDKVLYDYISGELTGKDSGSWFKIRGKEISAIAVLLDRNRLLGAFPMTKNYADLGYEWQILDSKLIDGEPCYVMHCRITDKQKFKDNAKDSINKLLSSADFSTEEKNKYLQDEVVDLYLKKFDLTQYISKKSFYTKRMVMEAYQKDTQGKWADSKQETKYYDINGSFSIDIPIEALVAPEIVIPKKNNNMQVERK